MQCMLSHGYGGTVRRSVTLVRNYCVVRWKEARLRFEEEDDEEDRKLWEQRTAARSKAEIVGDPETMSVDEEGGLLRNRSPHV